MSDDNRVGVVSRISQLQRQAAVTQTSRAASQAPQSQPQRGMPGLQPPVPSAEQIQRVMAEQARQRQLDMAETKRRTAALASGQDGEAEAQPSTEPARNERYGFILAEDGAEIHFHENANTVRNKTNNSVQNMSRPIKQLKQLSEPEIEPKIIVPWYPIRSKGISVELEESIIELMPDDLVNEGDPQAKVVLALLAEILYLRSIVNGGEGLNQEDRDAAVKSASMVANSFSEISGRVQRLEQAMYSQSASLQAQARSVHETVIELQKQGLSSDDILAKITGQSQRKTDPDSGQ